jgi:glycosyltransferase involved in cell wall biosynthesis
LRIVHLNTYDITGGAARATYRLHRGLRDLGHDSLMFVAHRRSDDPTVLAWTPPMDLTSRIRRRLRKEWITRSFSRYRLSRPQGYEKFSTDRSLHGRALVTQLPPCDLINLHWISDFVGYQSFFKGLPRQMPVVWRLADMNPLTGGCHFDDGCGKFATGCGACPQLGSTDRNDLSHRIWQRKLALFHQMAPSRLHIIALNSWMARRVERSPLLRKFPLTIIPNGIDTELFSPLPKAAARRLLELPQDAFLVLFVAYSVNVRRKGLDLLAHALTEPTVLSNLHLVSIGSGTPSMNGQIPHRHLGKIDDDRMLARVYSAADVFVCPSREDNLPNTVLEAMACGTPVVAFDAGGIPDMVRPEVTGLLVPTGDAEALRAAMVDLLRAPERRAVLGANCRRIALEEYSLEVQARRYAELYETTLRQVSPPHLPKAEIYSSSESP